MKVLLVEDDHKAAKAIVEALTSSGYHPRWCRPAATALDAHTEANLVLLDLDLRDLDGLDLLRRLRHVSALPVLVLANDTDEHSVVTALRRGADDYLVKPVRPRELLARMEAVTRRASRQPALLERVVQVHDMTVDLTARTVRVANAPVTLTTREFDVLAALARRAGTAVSRKQIVHEVWGKPTTEMSRTLDVHLTALRTKLARPDALQTIRGFGYRLG
jgi:DNA-binding response OmpR family regulator